MMVYKNSFDTFMFSSLKSRDTMRFEIAGASEPRAPATIICGTSTWDSLASVRTTNLVYQARKERPKLISKEQGVVVGKGHK